MSGQSAEKDQLQVKAKEPTETAKSLQRATDAGACACKPGTHRDGWQERRCEVCLDREREAWRQMLTSYAERTTPPASTSDGERP